MTKKQKLGFALFALPIVALGGIGVWAAIALCGFKFHLVVVCASAATAACLEGGRRLMRD